MIELAMDKAVLGYGKYTVLNDISFSVRPGEMVGLIGPNGCGKSTVIKALSGIIPLFAGKVLLDGKDIRQVTRRELAKMLGVVPQIPLLPSAYSALEIVLMGRNPHMGLFQFEGARDINIALNAMERTGTIELADRRVAELSGGEIQCLMVARAIAQETQAVLLDEPTANLDIGRQITVLDLVRNMCLRSNLAVLAVLHDLNLAAQYCDRLILLHDKNVQAEGIPAKVITGDNIGRVYGVQNCVYTHPMNGLPVVLLSNEEMRYTRNPLRGGIGGN